MSVAVARTCRHIYRRKWCETSHFSTSAKFLFPLKVGDRLPEVKVYDGSPQNSMNITDVFNGKKGILFSVVGAFTPGCSQAHIPEYLNNYDKFKEEGYEVIACVSVNDPFVMAAWGEDINAKDKIQLLADPQGEFTKRIDMELDTSKLLGTKRSKRYSLLIEDNVIKHVNMDPDSSGLACLLCIRNMKSGVEQAVGS